MAAYRALVRRYAEDDTTHARRRAGTWVRHEAILLDSAFCLLDEIVGDRAAPGDGRAAGRSGAVSRSSTAPDRLGEAAPMAADIEPREIEALLEADGDSDVAASAAEVVSDRTALIGAARPRGESLGLI